MAVPKKKLNAAEMIPGAVYKRKRPDGRTEYGQVTAMVEGAKGDGRLGIIKGWDFKPQEVTEDSPEWASWTLHSVPNIEVASK